jgi:hypothetical protein
MASSVVQPRQEVLVFVINTDVLACSAHPESADSYACCSKSSGLRRIDYKRTAQSRFSNTSSGA